MNLYDLVKRRDRMAVVASGVVEAIEGRFSGGSQRAIRLAADQHGLLLRHAHEASVLRALPTLPGWVAYPSSRRGRLRVWRTQRSRLEVWLESGDATTLLGSADVPGEPIRLHWPVATPAAFDLRLVACGGAVDVAVGPLFNPRTRLLPLLRGRGVEVGPGANPAVLPSADCEVSYVERMSAEQWTNTYGKGRLEASETAHWDRYVVDEGHELRGFADGSLDFVFSSHVLEHMVNPLGVLKNWWRKLASGGAIACVVPDARYTFDLRQPHSTRADFLEQFHAGSFELTDTMYERWCRHTEPRQTPQALKARDYSIHANYYSVDTACDLLDLFAEGEAIRARFVESVVNGKDFSLYLQKP
ncbi:MAG: methyltransferase domain-containing protein [Pseudoxanthomonas sp.]